ncbi:MAG: DMT family transporter [Patescibacteria group bacterium]|nr:DMT family transporter [Patescibacteria group bacterium]
MSEKIIFPTILALAAALVSGTNNFLTKIATTSVGDPIIYTTLKNSIVALILFGLILGFKKWPEIRNATKKQTLKLIAIGIIGGSIPFALYFTGLSQTNAINAALIHKTLFLWVFIFAIPFLKERLSKLQIFGVAIIFTANLFIGGFAGFKFNIGELMILGATILWAIENIIAKKTLQEFSSQTVAAARMILGSLVLFLFLLVRNGSAVFSFSLNNEQWTWTIITSILLFGYVTLWYGALKYAPATYVAVLLVPATLITNILSSIFVTHVFDGRSVLTVLLYIIGYSIFIVSAGKIKNSNFLSNKTSATTT